MYPGICSIHSLFQATWYWYQFLLCSFLSVFFLFWLKSIPKMGNKLAWTFFSSCFKCSPKRRKNRTRCMGPTWWAPVFLSGSDRDRARVEHKNQPLDAKYLGSYRGICPFWRHGKVFWLTSEPVDWPKKSLGTSLVLFFLPLYVLFFPTKMVFPTSD